MQFRNIAIAKALHRSYSTAKTDGMSVSRLSKMQLANSERKTELPRVKFSFFRSLASLDDRLNYGGKDLSRHAFPCFVYGSPTNSKPGQLLRKPKDVG